MQNLLRDIRYALRTILKSPGAAAVAVLALGLGIGANVSCFITVKALVLRPFPYASVDRIMTLWETVPKASAARDGVAAANFLDWRTRSRSFEAMAAYRRWDATLTGNGDPERVQACLASAELFQLLGLRPLMGRTFSAAETEPGRDAVVVVSQGFWHSRMASAPDAVGQIVTLGGRGYRVVGVMPADFDYPLANEVWAPLAMTGEEKNRRDARDLSVLARLKPGVTVSQARSELNGIAARLAEDFPKTNNERGAQVVPLLELTNQVTHEFVLTLFGAAGFVLLLACANVGNLQLSRAAAREKMIAIQAALGATRFHIARTLALESILLSLVGGGLGLFLASLNHDLSRNQIPAEILRWVAGIRNMRVDGTVLWFTLAASVAAGLVCGMPAAFHLLRPKAGRGLMETLKEGGRGSSIGSARSQLRSALVIFEVAMALVLLVGAGLMVNTFRRLLTISPGFDTRKLLMLQVSLPAVSYRDSARIRAFYESVLRELEAVPESKSAGAMAYMPAAEGVFIEGRPEPRAGELLPGIQAVSDRYIQTLGLPLLRGRYLSAQDGAESPRVVVLSESVVRHYWPGQPDFGEAVGRRIRLAGGQSPRLTVAGVVGDTRDWFSHQPQPTAYVPFLQSPQLSMELLVRTSGDPLRAVAAARSAVRHVDANQPVYEVKSMEQLIGEETSGVRVSAITMTIYAAIALLLAVTGIYAVMAYTVVQRTHEIGIRMALGANHTEVLKMTVGYAVRLAAKGLAIGVPVAFLLTRFDSHFLYDVVVVDPLTFLALTVILAAAALAASYIPARHATRVDPLVALRAE